MSLTLSKVMDLASMTPGTKLLAPSWRITSPMAWSFGNILTPPLSKVALRGPFFTKFFSQYYYTGSSLNENSLGANSTSARFEKNLKIFTCV